VLKPPAQQLRLVTKHVDIGDRLTAIGEHHRHIDQHPSTVVARGERATLQCRGDRPIRQ
jgi:hypothetical protein